MGRLNVYFPFSETRAIYAWSKNIQATCSNKKIAGYSQKMHSIRLFRMRTKWSAVLFIFQGYVVLTICSVADQLI